MTLSKKGNQIIYIYHHITLKLFVINCGFISY